MKLFSRKSKWDRLKDATAQAVSGDFRQAAKVTLSVVGGAIVATAASAAVSAVRQKEET